MRSISLFGLVIVVGMSTGCSMAVSTGVQVVKGVDAEVYAIEDVGAGRLAPYNTLKLGHVSTDIGPLCPPEMSSQIQEIAPRKLAEESGDQFRGGPKILRADIAVRFYKKKGLLGEGRLDFLVTLVDAESGAQVGKLYVEAITESPVHTGIDDMVKKATSDLAKYLKKKKEKGDEESDK